MKTYNPSSTLTVHTKLYPVYLFAALLLFTGSAVAADLSLRAQNIQNVTPDYINNVTVVDEEKGVRIEGQTANNKNLSRYMRFLEEYIGSPALLSMKRENNMSIFILQIKKFKQ